MKHFALCFVVLAAGCGSKMDYATIPGEALYRVRCATCHGPAGHGDGAMGANLQPKPRNLTDKVWQASVTDEHLRTVIARGGAAVGKASIMPPQPDLADHPEALGRLVVFVRGLAK